MSFYVLSEWDDFLELKHSVLHCRVKNRSVRPVNHKKYVTLVILTWLSSNCSTVQIHTTKRVSYYVKASANLYVSVNTIRKQSTSKTSVRRKALGYPIGSLKTLHAGSCQVCFQWKTPCSLGYQKGGLNLGKKLIPLFVLLKRTQLIVLTNGGNYLYITPSKVSAYLKLAICRERGVMDGECKEAS